MPAQSDFASRLNSAKGMIRVIDDGHGMTHDECHYLLFERHATSKLKTADDCYRSQRSDFAGRRWPSIAAVSAAFA